MYAPQEKKDTAKLASSARSQPAAATQMAHHASNGVQSLPMGLQAGLEQLSGIDMGDVRVHYNSTKPAQLQAHAYAQGNHIHLGPGQASTLPHEAWHVVQQKQGRVQATLQMKGLAVNHSDALEREADLMGSRAKQMSGQPSREQAAFAPPTRRPIYRNVAQLKGEVDLSDPKWLEKWYAKSLADKSGNADRKVLKMLAAMVSGDTSSKTFVEKIMALDLSTLRGDALSAALAFQLHIAPFAVQGKQGYDRSLGSHGHYYRSNPDHPVMDMYMQLLGELGIDTSSKKRGTSIPKPPMNPGFIAALAHNTGAQESQTKFLSTISAHGINYQSSSLSTASAGLPTNNFNTLLESQQVALGNSKAPGARALKSKLMMLPAGDHSIAPNASTTIKGDQVETGLTSIMSKLAGKITPAHSGSFHDFMLENRGALVANLTGQINTKSDPKLSSLSSEGHPSLMIHNKDMNYRHTGALADSMPVDWNKSTSDWDVLLSRRGSFGFQRPTLTDTGDSVRLWPGYAPIESLVSGLNKILKKDLVDPSTKQTSGPYLHVEALKTAVRHVQLALSNKPLKGLPPEMAHLAKWVQTRLLINLHKADFLLEKVGETGLNIHQHYLQTAGVIDRLQEYAVMYTSLSSQAAKAPSSFDNDADDPYEKHLNATLKTQLASRNYQAFYLDSGQQAIALAARLANLHKQDKDTGDEPGGFTDVSSYFELPMINHRFNVYEPTGKKAPFKKAKPTTSQIVSADLSPVITAPTTQDTSKAGVNTAIDQAIGAAKTRIPILDITNAPLSRVNDLKNLPTDFIIVESLTKHSQLGADKFIMGRLIAVGSLAFIARAKKIVGPAAQSAHNPLLATVRRNMDQVLYSNTVSSGVLSSNSGSFNVSTGASSGAALPPEARFKGEVTPESDHGLVNLGASCYLAAGLNTLAFNFKAAFEGAAPAELVTPELLVLRTKINDVLTKIIAKTAVTHAEMKEITDLMGKFIDLPLEEPQPKKKPQLKRIPSADDSQLKRPSKVGTEDTLSVPTVHFIDDMNLLQKKTKNLTQLSDKTLVAFHQKRLAAQEAAAKVEQEAAAAKKVQADAEKRATLLATQDQDVAEIVFNKLLDLLKVNVGHMTLSTRRHRVADAPVTDVGADTGYSELDTPIDERIEALDLPIANADNLQQAIDNFLNPAAHIAGVKFKDADRTKETTVYERLTLGDETPRVLRINLKRFNFDLGVASKIDKKVEMPHAFALNGRKYQLKSVVFHHGQFGGGHYTASTKEHDQWVHRNDRAIGRHDSFEHDKDFGYVYTYQCDANLHPALGGLLDLKTGQMVP